MQSTHLALTKMLGGEEGQARQERAGPKLTQGSTGGSAVSGIQPLGQP
jgi:hypothetical protein